MIHKFKDYNREEQREIVFELIRQKYLYEPNLNNFANNCKTMQTLIKGFESGQINADDLKSKFQDFYNKNKKVAEEILYYFYNIVEGVAEKSEPTRSTIFNKVGKIIKDVIDVETISNTIQPPEDKMGKMDNNGGGFALVSYSKYPAPASYVAPPPPPPIHDFKNPYVSKDFQSICDYVRYKFFDVLEDHSQHDREYFKGLADLDQITITEILPDSDEVVNFPQCETEDGDTEDLDFENYGDFVINNENSVTFSGGGDWQEPQTFSLKVKNGKIKAYDIYEGYDDGDYDAKGILKVICKLFGLNRKNYNVKSEDPSSLKQLYDDMVQNKDYKIK